MYVLHPHRGGCRFREESRGRCMRCGGMSQEEWKIRGLLQVFQLVRHPCCFLTCKMGETMQILRFPTHSGFSGTYPVDAWYMVDTSKKRNIHFEERDLFFSSMPSVCFWCIGILCSNKLHQILWPGKLNSFFYSF